MGSLGNFYDWVGVDVNGWVVIDWGVYGVLEIFIVDLVGIICYKFIGFFDLESYWIVFLFELKKIIVEN